MGSLATRVMFFGHLTTVGCVEATVDAPPSGVDETVVLDTAILVEDVELMSLEVSPGEVSLQVDDQIKLKATGIRGDRTSVDLTDVVQWSVSSSSVATVSNHTGSEGVLTSAGVGEAWVSVQFGSVVSPPASVTVTDALVVALAIDSPDLSVGIGDSASVSVTAAMDDGSTLDVSAIANWVIEDTSVAMVSADGLVFGIAAGSTRLQAELDGETAEPITIDVVPDAIVDLRVASTDGVVDGGLLLLSVDVENQGNGSAEGFWVDVFVDPIVPPIVGDIGDSFVWVDAVAGGATQRLDFTVPVSQATHSVVVFVDTEDVIEESVEQNNTASVTIQPPAQGADLVIDTVDWLVDETNVILDVLVRNAGDVEADRVFIDYFLDQSDAPAVFDFGDGYDTVGPLGPQETQWISWMTVASCDPECSAWILVDSLDEVEEADESNNVHGPSVVVSSVPLDTGWW